MMHMGLFELVLSVFLIILFIKIMKSVFSKSKKSGKESLELRRKKKIKDYKEAGLSDADIKVFRDTMAEAKQQIELWSKAVEKRTNLSVIEDLTGGLESAKKTFQFIVQNPQEITRQNDFLYKDLPNMVKLIESHEKLESLSVSNEDSVSEILLLIRTLSTQITENYRVILMKDVKIIEKEVQNG